MKMMPYLFVARTEPVRTPKFSSDNARGKRQFCRLSLALSLPVRSHPKEYLSFVSNYLVKNVSSRMNEYSFI